MWHSALFHFSRTEVVIERRMLLTCEVPFNRTLFFPAVFCQIRTYSFQSTLFEPLMLYRSSVLDRTIQIDSMTQLAWLSDKLAKPSISSKWLINLSFYYNFGYLVYDFQVYALVSKCFVASVVLWPFLLVSSVLYGASSHIMLTSSFFQTLWFCRAASCCKDVVTEAPAVRVYG